MFVVELLLDPKIPEDWLENIEGGLELPKRLVEGAAANSLLESVSGCFEEFVILKGFASELL